MKKIFFGFVLGLATVIVIFKLVERNHKQILEIVKHIPRPAKWDPENIRKVLFKENSEDDLVA